MEVAHPKIFLVGGRLDFSRRRKKTNMNKGGKVGVVYLQMHNKVDRTYSNASNVEKKNLQIQSLNFNLALPKLPSAFILFVFVLSC